jgi:hypothetical protein
MMKLRLLTTLLGLFVLATSLTAQQESLVGAWELVSQTNADGQPNPNPNLLLIFTRDGIYSQIGIAKGRPKLDKPANQLTEAEFRARFTGVQGNHGTYTVSGNRITRQAIAAINPANEGTQQVLEFRIEGNTLILRLPETKGEQRFRRAGKAAS